MAKSPDGRSTSSRATDGLGGVVENGAGDRRGRCQIDQNPNRFWHLIGDVIAKAKREGSLDSRIRDHATNDLAALVAALPNLAAVAFNGGTAAKIGMQALAEIARSHQATVEQPRLCGCALWREVEGVGNVAQVVGGVASLK